MHTVGKQTAKQFTALGPNFIRTLNRQRSKTESCSIRTTVYIHRVKETVIINWSVLIPVPIKLKLFPRLYPREVVSKVRCMHAKTIHSGARKKYIL